MTDEQIINIINNLETKIEGIIQKEIQHGMDLLGARMNSTCAEKESETKARLATLEENIRKKDDEITQLFSFVNEIKNDDKRQEAILAANRGANIQADKMKTFWISAAGVVVAIVAFFIGKK